MTDKTSDSWLLLPELVGYLGLAPDIIDRLARRRMLPADRAGGRWRFDRAEVDKWLDLGMPGWPDEGLRSVAASAGRTRFSVPYVLKPSNVLLGMPAQDGQDCLRRAVASMRLPTRVDRLALLRSLLQREALCSTALDHGVAIPHTPRTGPRLLPQSTVALVRLARPIAFGGRDGEDTDLFFFVLAADQAAQLALLSRFMLLARFPHVAEMARAANTAEQVIEALERVERWLFQRSALSGDRGGGGG